MSNEKEREQIGEELFIEELGEIRGGLTLTPGKFTTLARGLGEEGTSVRIPVLRKPIWVVGKPPPKMSTMMLGEEGASLPHPIALSNDE